MARTGTGANDGARSVRVRRWIASGAVLAMWVLSCAMPTAASESQSERDARLLFEHASTAREAGRLIAAQRAFELLVAGHPESPFADAARRKLIDLYLELEAASARLSRAPRSGLGRVDGPPPAVGGTWTVEVQPDAEGSKVGESVISDFRLTAGDRIFFAAGSARLGARAKTVLRAQAAWLKRHRDIGAVIEGHADDPGDSAFNRQLAAARARAVADALKGEGVPPGRVEYRSWGREKPLAVCADAACTAQNRRAVTVLQIAPGTGARIGRQR